jgi:hypothetical protein
MRLRLVLLGSLAMLASSCTSSEHAAPGDGPKPGSAPPLVGEIQCLDSGPRVLTPAVRAQPDGVHFKVVNRAAGDLRIRFEGGGEWPLLRGPSALVVTVQPGPVTVACHPRATHDRELDPTAEILVVDPAGFYGSRTLDCRPTQLVSIFADGEIGDTVEEAARGLLRNPARSQIVHVGYPQADRVGALVIHGGRAVAELLFVRTSDGGLALEGTHSCAVGQSLLRY